MRHLLFLCLLVAALPPALGDDSAKIVEVRKIWDQAPHNAFTDLVRFDDRWFCVFREGAAHVSPDGALRVITSADGQTWESAALITSPDSDLRDAKITVTPDGQLMLCGAGALHDKSQKTHQSLAWFSKDGRTWSQPHEIGDANYWLWRVTWHKGGAYGIGYGCGPAERSVRLYSSRDGKQFDTLVERLIDVGYPNETSIVFEGDTALCLLRRDGEPNGGLLGTAQPPYTKWEWKDVGTRIGGPHMIRLADGRYVAAVRLYDKQVRTSLCWIDPASGKLTELLPLPSGGDTSYAGLVLHDGLLWISYYSSHEGKTSIYLAKVQFSKPVEGRDAADSDAAQSSNAPVRDIGSRRELFVDDWLIERLDGAALRAHRPEPAEVVLTCDAPWEGNTSAYFTLFADGDRFRMYYRGSHWDEEQKKAAHPEFTCYAESRDGIHWTKPSLGLFEYGGSKDNNIVWAGEGTHCFTPFKDANPDCPPEARYKALSRGAQRGLRAYQSPDGIHWKLATEDYVITDGNFDSQNLAFWDAARGRYASFHRKMRDGARDIMTATSADFLRWTQPEFLDYGDAPKEHLYTNAVQPYSPAPHLLVGFPTRFQPRTQQVEPILMTSRDGKHFRRWPEPLIPITAPAERDGNRSNYMAWGILSLPGRPNELSVYATERYYAGPGSRLRRFAFRTDGFVSVHAHQGEMLTRPLLFAGNSLAVNYRTTRSGSVKIELQDVAGQALPGFTLAECQPLRGDAVDQTVNWSKGSDVSRLASHGVRMRFVLQDADVFAMQFQTEER
jgi:hypothetical protein